MFGDMQKMFDIESFNKMFNMDDMTKTQKETSAAVQKASSVLADGMNKAFTKQMQTMQSSMQEGVEAMRELSDAKGVEDMMSKQSELARKSFETMTKAQSEVLSTMQKSWMEASDIMSKQWLATTGKATKTGGSSTSK